MPVATSRWQSRIELAHFAASRGVLVPVRQPEDEALLARGEHRTERGRKPPGREGHRRGPARTVPRYPGQKVDDVGLVLRREPPEEGVEVVEHKQAPGPLRCGDAHDLGRQALPGLARVVGYPDGISCRGGDRPERRGSPRSPSADDSEAAAGVVPGVVPPLLRREVEEPEDPGIRSRRGRGKQAQLGERHDRGKRVAPRAPDRVAGRNPCPLDVAGRGPRDLDVLHPSAVDGHDHPAGGSAGQVERGGGADDRDTVGSIDHAEGQADRAVREDLVPQGGGRALAAQHEVQPERPAPCRDVGEELVKLGERAAHRGELVHEDHEARQDAVAELLDGADGGRGDHPLAIPHFGGQAVEGAEGGGRVEVGDDTDAVWERAEGVEGGAALEVDAEQGDGLRRVSRGEGDRPADEQFALATAGRAADHGVGPIHGEVDTPVAARTAADGAVEAGAGFGSRTARRTGTGQLGQREHRRQRCADRLPSPCPVQHRREPRCLLE